VAGEDSGGVSEHVRREGEAREYVGVVIVRTIRHIPKTKQSSDDAGRDESNDEAPVSSCAAEEEPEGKPWQANQHDESKQRLHVRTIRSST
jgi:hypothetical protein